MRLLRFYHAAQSARMELSGSGYVGLVALKKELGLGMEDIAARLDWLDIIREHSSFTKVDAKEFALKAAQEK